MKTVFVTGATGLLGNNLVRALLERNFKVKILVRSLQKAQTQFNNLPLDIIEGDITNVESYRVALDGCEAIFHTAAFFRDNYKGGDHWQTLEATNIKGTQDLLEAAYDAGIRHMVHASSIAVLKGERGQLIDETMQRPLEESDNYYRSKILADEVITTFLADHPEMFAVMVLPGWMFGPGDAGPTSAGQTVLDFVQRKFPGIIPGTFSVVDARDVAEHMISALTNGKRGERYNAAGHCMTMAEVFQSLEKVTGIASPTKPISLRILKLMARFYEVYHLLTKKPILLSGATVKLIEDEYDRTHFSHEKSAQDLGCSFRPVEETFADVVRWYQQHELLAETPLRV